MNKQRSIFVLLGILCFTSPNVMSQSTEDFEDTTFNFQTTESFTNATAQPTTTGPRTTPPPGTYSCVPAEDCLSYGIGKFVPDPLDCQRYYVCINSNGVPIPAGAPSTCPQGQYFDGPAGTCVPETSNGICISACGPNVCSNTCPPFPPTITYAADENDCSVYDVCFPNGQIIPTVCPVATPYFNGVSCVSDPAQCCKCRALCQEIGSEFQDPCDCTSFYICSAVGQPHSNNRGSCPVGNYFDDASLQCLPGNCQNICPSCV